MEPEVITINEVSYFRGPKGALFDADMNICGFLGAESLQKAGCEPEPENFVDEYVGAVLSNAQAEGEKIIRSRSSGIHPALAIGIAVGGSLGAAIGNHFKNTVPDRKAQQELENAYEGLKHVKRLQGMTSEARKQHLSGRNR